MSGDKQPNILWFKDITIGDIPKVGGKTASLGEMYSKLKEKGILVPNGFAVTAMAYWSWLRGTGLDKKIKKILMGLDVANVSALAKAGKTVRALILKAELPSVLKKEILTAYRALSQEHPHTGDHPQGGKEENAAVAIRSSATAEDLPDASFAGQQETYLNVVGEKQVLEAVKKCIASLYTDRAISYRETKGFDHNNIALSVCVQRMVRSDVGASGVMFTIDTESGFSGVVLINAAYGLGEYVVKGRVTPDQFYVLKMGVKNGKPAVLSRILGTKEAKLVYADAPLGGRGAPIGHRGGTKQATVTKSERDRFCLTDAEVAQLAAWGVAIEEHYKKPQDIEWAKDGKTGELYIVQARPETVKAQTNHAVIEEYRLKQKGTALARGISIGQKIGAGHSRVIDEPKQMAQFKKGEVLVTRITDPDWEPIMRLASAIVTEEGGKTSHAAIVSRELGVPCVVGVEKARKLVKTGAPVTVSCAEGEEGMIYQGILPFEVKRTPITDVAKTKTKIMMNVGDPDNAFALSFLPNDGVGLAREEFIFSNFIRIHPLALIHYNRLKDKAAKRQIAKITRAYKNKEQYCVDKLAEGIGRIAAAFYPNDVVIRFSDFKTNEYATLIGGREFEPKEANPMLGWRGASRYYSKEYKEGFRLECEAIKKVRDDFGLTNVITMVPFCRTPEEGEKVIQTMAEFGLKRGDNGLRVYVMCEIPSNVILAEEFAKIFDGFSIGSNDLTQLTLGVDRDSAMVHHIYNERNEAVKNLIRQVIRVAKAHKRKIGICGQAPSDYPEFAEFLVREGVDSISLNPDSVMATRERIAAVEKTIGRTGAKTHKTAVGAVAMMGLLSAGLIGLGAGCSLDGTSRSAAAAPNAELSPAELRERFTARLKEDKAAAVGEKQKEIAALMTTIHITSFANLTTQYPVSWTVEEWRGGVTFRNMDTKEYVSVFNQLVDHPVSADKKKSITVGGKAAARYDESVAGSDMPVSIVEIRLSKDQVLEIDGQTKEFDRILQSVTFPAADAKTPDRPLTHWDIREKRVCVQVIAYAKKNKGEQCQMFSTPCDVPSGWQVCDSSDQ